MGGWSSDGGEQTDATQHLNEWSLQLQQLRKILPWQTKSGLKWKILPHSDHLDKLLTPVSSQTYEVFNELFKLKGITWKEYQEQLKVFLLN